jgi:hypothetical protein
MFEGIDYQYYSQQNCGRYDMPLHESEERHLLFHFTEEKLKTIQSEFS